MYTYNQLCMVVWTIGGVYVTIATSIIVYGVPSNTNIKTTETHTNKRTDIVMHHQRHMYTHSIGFLFIH